jgi:hypothetical protein
MKKIIMVCICTTLFLGIPFTSLAITPQQLVPNYQKIAHTPNNDPDGPYAGGLDDITDWINLLSFIGNLLIVPGFLLALSYTISEQQGLISLVMNSLFLYWTVRYGVVDSFAEAFDINDVDEDGS